jgi:hypothetical protein
VVRGASYRCPWHRRLDSFLGVQLADEPWSKSLLYDIDGGGPLPNLLREPSIMA